MPGEIESVFRDVLSRDPRSDEASYYGNQLAFGRALGEIRHELAYSPEAQVDIDAIYWRVAGRGATGDEVAVFEDALSQGGDWTLGSVQWNIGHSDAATAAINGVYQQMLGHPSDYPELLTAYENNMGAWWINWSLADVRWNLAHRPEAATGLISLYEQVTGRDPTEGEIAVWENNALGQGNSLAEVRAVVAGTPEVGAQIDALFHQVLGRGIDASGIAFFEGQLAAGWSLSGIRTAIAHSPEAAVDIDGIYQRVAGRAATGDEMALFQNALSQGGDWTLGSVQWNIAHTDAARIAIDGIYQQMLGHASNDPGLLVAFENNLGASWVNWTLADVRWDLAHKPEATSDVVGLYQQVLGRDPIQAEIGFWEDNALAQGASVGQVRYALAHSPEAASNIDGLYHRVAGRGANGDEIALFENALSQGGDWTLGSVQWNIAHTDAATAAINGIYQQMFGHGANDPGLLTAYEANMGAWWVNWSLADVRWDLAHRPEATSDVVGLYQQVLGRDPIQAEIGVYENNALAQGASMSQVRYALAHSPEAAADIDGFYRRMAGRAATGDELTLFETALSQGGDWTLGSVQWNIAHTDAARIAIDGVYQQMLGHPSNDPGLLAAYENNMGAWWVNWSLADVRWNLAHKPEAAAGLVSLYEQVTGRDPSAAEIASWEDNALAHGNSLAEVRAVVAGTPEVGAQIDAIFHQVLGRGIDASGIAFFEGQLAAGWSLSGIRTAIAHSPEAAADIDGIYQRVAGRAATGDEVALFQNALSQGGDWNLGSVQWNIAHTDAARIAIDGVYQQMLGHPSNDPGLLTAFEANMGASWVNWTLADVRRELAHKPEATADIVGIYQQVIGRDPSQTEIGIWEDGALAQGASVSQIRYALAHWEGTAARIDGFYRQVAGRAATGDEIATFEDALSQGGDWNLGSVQWNIAHTDAARIAIDGVYQQMLGHASNDPGLLTAFENNMGAWWVNWSLADVRWDLAHKPEAMAGLAAIYQQGLGYPGGPGDITWATDALGHGSSLAIIRSVVFHSDLEATAISAAYQDILGHPAGAPDIAWQEDHGLMQGLSLAGIRHNLATSSEVQADIAAAFTNELGRPAQAFDLAYWEGALEQGQATMQSMRAAFAQTPEATALLGAIPQQMLGHAPDPTYMAWARGILAQGGSVDAVRAAIVHSPEAMADFDAGWYLAQHPDVAASGMDPYVHYLTVGWLRGYDPSAAFSTSYYLQQNPDVAAAGVNPLLHYRNSGWREGRNPSASFNTQLYLATYLDVAAAGVDPLAHYVNGGRTEGRVAFAAPPNPVLAAESTAIDAFYQKLFGRNALNTERGNIEMAVAAGQTLQQVFDALRPVFAHSDFAHAIIDGFYQAHFGRNATQTDRDNIEANLAAGQSLATIELFLLLPAAANAFYQQLFGRDAEAAEVASIQAATNAGQTLQQVFDYLRPNFIASPYQAAVVNAFYQQHYNRQATDGELVSARAALSRGQSLADVEQRVIQLVATVDVFYQSLFARDATAEDITTIQAAVDAGQTLQQAFEYLRPIFIAGSYEADVINAFYQQHYDRQATSGELVSARAALTNGRSLVEVEQRVIQLVATVDAFYQSLFARPATAEEVTTIQAALDAGQTLPQVFDYLRPLFAISPFETAILNAFCWQTLGRLATQPELDAAQAALAAGKNLATVEQTLLAPQATNALYQQIFGRDATAQELGTILAALDAGQSLQQVFDFLRPNLVYSTSEDGLINSIYSQVTGGGVLGEDDLFAAEDAVYGGASLADVRDAFAHSDAAAQAIGGIYLDVFGRDATAAEIADREADLAGTGTLPGMRTALAEYSVEAGNDIDKIYSEVLGHHADPTALTYWRDTLASGTSLGDVRWTIAHLPEAAAKIRSTAAPTTGTLELDGPNLEMIEAALAAGASIDTIAPGLAYTVSQEVTYDTQGNVTSFTNVIDPHKTARNVAVGFYATVLGRGASTDELAGVEAAFSSGLSPSTLITARDQAGGILGQTTAERLLIEMPVFVTLNNGVAPVLYWEGGALAGDGAQIAAFLLALQGRAGRLNPKVLAIYAEVASWMDTVAQQLLQLSSVMGRAAQGDTGDQRAIELEISKLALSLATMPAAVRAQIEASGTTERITLGGHQADVTVFRDGATGDWTYSVHDIDNTDWFLIAVQAVALVASVVVLVASGGSSAPLTALLAGELTAAAVATAVAITADLVLAGNSFANGDVLGGLLSLAAATGVGVKGLGVPGSDLSRAGGLILAARGVVGGVAGAVQAAEQGNGIGIAASVLSVAAATAAGDISTQDPGTEVGRAAIKSLTDVGYFLTGAATAAGIANAVASGNVQAGLFASLNGVLTAYSIASGVAGHPLQSSGVEGTLSGVGGSESYPASSGASSDTYVKISAYAGNMEDVNIRASQYAMNAVISVPISDAAPTIAGESVLKRFISRVLLGGSAGIASIFFSPAPTGGSLVTTELPDGTIVTNRSDETLVFAVTKPNAGHTTYDAVTGVLRSVDDGSIAGIVLRRGDGGDLQTFLGRTVGYVGTQLTIDPSFVRDVKAGNAVFNEPEQVREAKVGVYQDRIKNKIDDQLDPATLEAADREHAGEVVAVDPQTGKPYDHETKVKQAVKGLESDANAIERMLNHDQQFGPSLTNSQKTRLTEILEKARQKLQAVKEGRNWL